MFKKILLGLALLGLTVQGQTSKIPLDNLQIGKSATGDKKIIFNRGGTNPVIKWDESDGAWQISNDGSTFTSVGDLKAVDSPYPDLMSNGGFESGTTGWTASGGTLSLETSFPYQGLKHGIWDSNSAAQTLTSAAVAVPFGLYQRPLEASCMVSTGFVTPVTITMGFWDGTTLTNAQTVFATPGSERTRILMPSAPGSGTLAIRFTSVAADEPAIFIDGCTITEALFTGTKAVTANYTLTPGDREITGATAGGAFTLTLPNAIGLAGKQFTIRKTDTSANLLSVATTSSQIIGGGSATGTKLHRKGEYIIVQSDGAGWVYLTPEDRSERISFGATNTTTCSSTPCNILQQSGNWVASVSRASTGVYSVNMTSGVFSAIPTCTFTLRSGSSDSGILFQSGTMSTTLIPIVARNLANVSQDVGADIVCLGPR